MKNIIKALIVTTTFLTVGSMQVFATNFEGANPVANYITSSNSNAKDHAYIEKSKAIREEIKTLNIQIKELREYNQSVNAKLKTLSEKYKADKNSVSGDIMQQVKELRKQIKTVDTPERTVTEDDSIKTLVQNREYDKALAKLNETLEHKKEQLKTLQERNAIWRQIDALIG